MSLKCVYQQQWESTLTQLASLEKDFSAWVFADQASRQLLTQQLSERGVKAKLFSAYKPLVYHFRETAMIPEGTTSIVIRTPAHPLDSQSRRFRLEAYPLQALLSDYELILEPKNVSDHVYEISYFSKDKIIAEESVFAPNRCRYDHTGSLIDTPCGWIKFSDESLGQPLETDLERLFAELFSQLQYLPYASQEPYFERLRIRLDVPVADCLLGWGEEQISLVEALHEELYFSLIEFFTLKSELPLGSRELQPGQIVPDVRYSENSWQVQVFLEPYQLPKTESLTTVPYDNLTHLAEPLIPEQIRAILQNQSHEFAGEYLSVSSCRGLDVPACYFVGRTPGVVITAAQHANETSGTAALLRAIPELRQCSDRALAVLPMHNPEGAELYHQLRQHNPRHMLHAARYTAMGNDIQSQPDGLHHEKWFRDQMIQRTGAKLHLNLHGYPSHEWTRPMTGYSPRGFELWSIPKGFFLIIRHQPGYEQQAREFIIAITQKLAQLPELAEYNRRQLRCYQTHAGELPFEVINGVACDISCRENWHAAIELVTEYPDESSLGEDYQLAHQTQLELIRAVYQSLPILDD